MRVNRYNIEQTESYFLWASNLHQGSYVYCAGTSSRAQRGTSTIQIDPWGLAGEGGSGNSSIKSDIGTSPWSTNDFSDEFGIFDSSHEYRLATPLSPGVDRWHWGYSHRYASSRLRWASDNAGPLPFHGDGRFVGNNLSAGRVGVKGGGEALGKFPSTLKPNTSTISATKSPSWLSSVGIVLGEGLGIDDAWVTIQSGILRVDYPQHLDGRLAFGSDITLAGERTLIGIAAIIVTVLRYVPIANKNNWLRIGVGGHNKIDGFRIASGAARKHINEVPEWLQPLNRRIRGHLGPWKRSE